MERAHKVYREVLYCNTCYTRLFKRRLCGGCGMFHRLLVSDPKAICTACIKKQPCVRCLRIGRPLGKLTATGPVCASCRVHFVELEPCEGCAVPSARLSRRAGDPLAPRLCPRCSRDHHTCSECRRHRRCEKSEDGRWVCRKCAIGATSTCSTCGSEVAAGANGRCEHCYWTQKCEIDAGQLATLVPAPRVQRLFAQFAAWAAGKTDPKRTALALMHHVKFFVELAAIPERDTGGWTGADILTHFKTSGLRAHELPTRWLTAALSLEISSSQKTASSEVRRFTEQLASVAQDHPAHDVLEAFHQMLSRRVADEEIAPRTARMSFRPAIDMMSMASGALPSQDDVVDYLAKAPGQRAAIFAFAGFLRASYALNLAVPAPGARAIAYRRRRSLERGVREMMLQWPRPAGFDEQWRALALMYFHWLTRKDASQVLVGAKVVSVRGGFDLEHGSDRYWIPDPPRPFSSFSAGT